MHVYLVRHGETFLAHAGVHQSPNTPLSPKGKEQAESAAEYLRSVNPDLILTSGYTRAVETARVIGHAAGLKPVVHDLFYEIIRPSSLYHKRLVSIGTARYLASFFLKRKDATYHYEDAENYADISTRAVRARAHLETLAQKHEVVVVVSHTVFLHVLLSLLCTEKMPTPWAFLRIAFGTARFPYASVMHLACAKTAPKSKTCAWSIVEPLPSPRGKSRRIALPFARVVRMSGYALLCISIAAVAALAVVIDRSTDGAITAPLAAENAPEHTLGVFPVGVDTERKAIVEDAAVATFFEEHIADEEGTPTAWFRKTLGRLALSGIYQNLASLSQRTLVIQPGERKEQIAQHFGKILGWTPEEKDTFLTLVVGSDPAIEEGKFFPATYTVGRTASPEEVAYLVLSTFNTEVRSRYSEEVAAQVALPDALTIASLLEREAYDFTDMREISGVIWNRLFAGMKLQIDATLQYAKGTESKEMWWPTPRPADKYIDSAYNTYIHEGLPPTPIASPSLAAILAALNPVKTDCMYYFHDKKAGFHCSETYEEHVALLKEYYGRGK